MKFKKRDNCYYLYTTNKDSYESIDWLIFYWGWYFDISYQVCGYFDNRPRINLDLIFFSLTIILPFTNKWINECNPPKYGISIHGKTLWINKGGGGNMWGGSKWWTWNIPFITKDWVRTSILLKDGTWEHETNSKRKDFYLSEWDDKKMKYTYDYTDSYDGQVIPTTIYVEEREWRPDGLKWTGLFAKKIRDIDVHFSEECGKGKGSWKGGTIGCGYEMKLDESPIDCIKRMEKERQF